MAHEWSDDCKAVCRTWTGKAPSRAIISEPYLPYVPDGWNGMLVLAESQNLSNEAYRRNLESLPQDAKILRLYSDRDNIGVGPWDGRSLKFAVAVIKGWTREEVARTAVSNAVPWSAVSDKGKNQNPTDDMVHAAVDFWRELLATWNSPPDTVVTVGKVAKDVVNGTKGAWPADVDHIALRSSSRNYVSRVKGLFSMNRLLKGFPEVEQAAEAWPEVVDDTDKFFACHALSMVRS